MILEWIPAGEQLPKENGRYLTVIYRQINVEPEKKGILGEDGPCIRITPYYYGPDHKTRKWFLPHHSPDWINEAITDTVTHWMPLPEIPEDLK